MFGKMVLAARLVLGIFYVLSGLNWFIGLIPVLPHIGMPDDLPIRHVVVAEMIHTGWMFQSAKVLELLFGIALLANRLVPLMLAVTLPVVFIIFGLDALILDDLWGWVQGSVPGPDLWTAIMDMVIGGLCVLLPHLWLMWCYSAYYRPAMAWKAEPVVAWKGGSAGTSTPVAAMSPSGPALRLAFFAFGWIALAFQTYNLVLFSSMIEG